MTRRRAFDWALIVVLTAVWAALFARALGDGLRTQRAVLPIAVSAADGADAYPIVKSGRPQPPGLEPGDELSAVDGVTVRGASALRFYDLATRAARERGHATLSVNRAGSAFSLRLDPVPTPAWWLPLVYSAALLATGLVLLVRVPNWHLARRYLLASWCFAIPRVAFEQSGGPAGTFAEVDLAYLGWVAASVLTIWIAQEFTRSARPVPALHRVFALPAGILLAATYWVRYYWPLRTVAVSDLMLLGSVMAIAAAALAGLTRAYVRSAMLERRQIRWVVFGFDVALLGAVASVAVSPLITLTGALEAPRWIGGILFSATGLALPIGVWISVVGYGWLDVDRLISAAASYTIIGIALLGAALALVPRAATAAGPALGMEPSVVQWLLTMALVLGAVPTHRYLRPRLDRTMFAERHRRVAQLEELVDQLAGCANADELWALASARIDAALEPESLVVCVREGQEFVGRFARGAAAPAPRAADSLLVRALERRGLPLAAESSALDPFDRAALETLGVALVVPIGTPESLLAFACLGPKRSGDIYTREEVVRLAAIAARCAATLAPAAPPAPVQIFRRDGELWTIDSRGKQVQLRDMRGLRYLAILLREPGREFAALDLVRAASGVAPLRAASEPELRVARRLADAVPALDARARAEYRQRVAELDAEQADAERCADLGRVERAGAEREALLAELESAARPRNTSSEAERARIAVTKVIKHALERIADAHPELGAHLAATVRRGNTCAYEPDPRDPADWET